jgi:hypothetical protein
MNWTGQQVPPLDSQMPAKGFTRHYDINGGLMPPAPVYAMAYGMNSLSNVGKDNWLRFGKSNPSPFNPPFDDERFHDAVLFNPPSQTPSPAAALYKKNTPAPAPPPPIPVLPAPQPPVMIQPAPVQPAPVQPVSPAPGPTPMPPINRQPPSCPNGNAYFNYSSGQWECPQAPYVPPALPPAAPAPAPTPPAPSPPPSSGPIYHGLPPWLGHCPPGTTDAGGGLCMPPVPQLPQPPPGFGNGGGSSYAPPAPNGNPYPGMNMPGYFGPGPTFPGTGVITHPGQGTGLLPDHGNSVLPIPPSAPIPAYENRL